MSKKILVTSTDLMMIQFLVPHIINLSENGYEVSIACSNVGGRMQEVKEKLKASTKEIYTVRLHRSPVCVDNMNGYRDMKKIICENHYDVIWINEPVMGVVTRLAAQKARKKGTKVLYVVHGFHFYKGAPLLNWLIYYPIEKIMASKCDMICTVNCEDYQRARKFNVQEVRYIHGVGINTERLTISKTSTNIRQELKLSENEILVLSIGELNKNKNQKVIIQAIKKINNKQLHYILCGKGDQEKELRDLAIQLGIEKYVHFLGYRKDVVDICIQSDIYVMPSYREGLPVSSLEAMYCGLPLVTSKIRGLEDIMKEGKTGYMCKPEDAEGFADRINTLLKNSETRTKMGQYNKEAVKPYCVNEVKKEVLKLIVGLMK